MQLPDHQADLRLEPPLLMRLGHFFFSPSRPTFDYCRDDSIFSFSLSFLKDQMKLMAHTRLCQLNRISSTPMRSDTSDMPSFCDRCLLDSILKSHRRIGCVPHRAHLTDLVLLSIADKNTWSRRNQRNGRYPFWQLEDWSQLLCLRQNPAFTLLLSHQLAAPVILYRRVVE